MSFEKLTHIPCGSDSTYSVLLSAGTSNTPVIAHLIFIALFIIYDLSVAAGVKPV